MKSRDWLVSSSDWLVRVERDRQREREREREREMPVTSMDITLKSQVMMHMITLTAGTVTQRVDAF